MTGYWTGKRVVVTGGAGLIGSYVAEELLRRGSRVIVADNLSKGSLDNLKGCLADIDFRKVDVRCRETCGALTAKVDVVLNLASRAFGVGYASAHHSEMLLENLAINSSMIEAACKNRVERFLVTSSACVYAEGTPVPFHEDSVNLSAVEQANEGYGFAKLVAEREAQIFAREYPETLFSIARPFNVYSGRYRWLGDGSQVIPMLVKKVMEAGAPVVVWGTGNQTRDFLHASDCARGLIEIAEKHPRPEAVNLASGVGTSMRELVAAICTAAGVERRIEFDTSKPEGAPRKEADIRRLRERIPAFRGEVSLEEGMREMVDWYGRLFSHAPQH